MTPDRQPRIVLIRHGRSALDLDGEWVDASGLDRWRLAYDAAAIATDDHPAAALVERAARADAVIASDLPRAVMSAGRLAGGREIVVSPLLRECDPAIPTWLPWRWPLPVWEAAAHVQWFYRIVRGTDVTPDVRDRVTAAADWLVALAREQPNLAVVTHGVFRRLLALHLIATGWTAAPGPWSYKNWSAWELHSG